METLYAIGMIVGIMKAHAEPPKAAMPPVEQHQVVQPQVEQHPVAQTDKAHPRKKSDWPLSY